MTEKWVLERSLKSNPRAGGVCGVSMITGYQLSESILLKNMEQAGIRTFEDLETN